jgi:hypothetical protein
VRTSKAKAKASKPVLTYRQIRNRQRAARLGLLNGLFRDRQEAMRALLDARFSEKEAKRLIRDPMG